MPWKAPIGRPSCSRVRAQAHARRLETGAREAHRVGMVSRAHRGAVEREGGHGERKALALLAQPVGRGDAASLEAQLGQHVEGHDVHLAGDGKARPVGLDEKGAKPARRARIAGARENGVEVGDAAVRDKDLGAVEHVVVALAGRAGFDACDIGARPAFGQREGADGLAARHHGQPALALGFIAGRYERIGAQPLHREGGGSERADAREFLADQAGRHAAHPVRRATVGGGHEGTEPARRREAVVELAGARVARRFERLGRAGELFGCERGGFAPHRGIVRAVLEVHRAGRTQPAP